MLGSHVVAYLSGIYRLEIMPQGDRFSVTGWGYYEDDPLKCSRCNPFDDARTDNGFERAARVNAPVG